jgi:hypothetical protein
MTRVTLVAQVFPVKKKHFVPATWKLWERELEPSSVDMAGPGRRGDGRSVRREIHRTKCR